MEKECSMCNSKFLGVPNLICRHFICPHCYVKCKSINSKCKCPFCEKPLKRDWRTK